MQHNPTQFNATIAAGAGSRFDCLFFQSYMLCAAGCSLVAVLISLLDSRGLFFVLDRSRGLVLVLIDIESFSLGALCKVNRFLLILL